MLGLREKTNKPNHSDKTVAVFTKTISNLTDCAMAYIFVL